MNDFGHYFAEGVKRAIQYDEPGSWMPSLPAGCIRLSAGYPPPFLVPSIEISSAVSRLVEAEGDLPFQYLGTAGTDALADWIRTRLCERGIPASSNDVLVTSGAYQALDLIAHTLCDRDTPVLVEEPTYMEALEIFHNYTDNIIGVEMDDQGLSTESLSEWLRTRKVNGEPMPRFLYTIPSYHNPTGTTLPLHRRRELLGLAEDYDFLIVEDDAYGELSFNSPPTPLKAVDNAGRVLHVGSLSKVVGPGLRIGWVVGHKKLIETLGWMKKDLGHPFGEASVAYYLQSVDWSKRLESVRAEYRRRRDVMVAALERWMPAGVSWIRPDGGYFIWVHVPEMDTREMLKAALEAGTAYVPGSFFYSTPNTGREFLRLSFSYVDDEGLAQGVQRLAEVIGKEMENL